MRAHAANSHKGKGWEPFTDAIIRAVNAKTEPTVFVLLGGFAQKKEKLIDNPKHILSAGLGLELPGLGGIVLRPVAIDLALAVTMLAGREHDKLVAADPIGDYRSGGAVVAASLGSRWRF